MSDTWLKFCDRIDGVIQAGCRWVIYLATTLLFVCLVINVSLRYLAGTSWQAAGEAPEYIFPWLVMSGVVLAAQKGAHISIVWIVEKLSPSVRLIVSMIHACMLIAGYSILVYAAAEMLPLVHMERSHILGLPKSVTFLCATLGFLFLVISEIIRLIRMFITKTISGQMTYE